MPASAKPPAKPVARAKSKAVARSTAKAAAQTKTPPAAKAPARPKKAPARPVAEPLVQTAPPDKPFLRFYHSESLRARTLSVITALEQASDSTRYRGALSNLILELTDSGFDYFFLKPLKLVRAGFVLEQSAQLGMSGVRRVMAPVVRNILSRLDQRQLRAISAYLRQLME
jgi:hypothetical protein